MDERRKDLRETMVYGTWWHSTIPSLDPVGLTWQKPSAAEIDAQEVFVHIFVKVFEKPRTVQQKQDNCGGWYV